VAETSPEQPPPEPPAPRPAHHRRWWILVGIGLLVVLGLVLLRRDRGDASKPGGPGAQARVVPVGVTAAERRDVPIWLEGLGNVTSLATVTVRARVSGQIVSIAFQEGTWSSRGAPGPSGPAAVQDRGPAGGGHRRP
jgi:multidrug efflux system membrane fusion protein